MKNHILKRFISFRIPYFYKFLYFASVYQKRLKEQVKLKEK